MFPYEYYESTNNVNYFGGSENYHTYIDGIKEFGRKITTS